MNLFKNKPQVWIITGCSRGLGLAIAQAALEAGHTVIASGRQPELTAKALSEYGEKVRTPYLDVTDNAEIERVVADTVKEFGRIDVLINNAGYGQLGAFETVSEADVRAQFNTNLFGTMAVTRAVLPQMRKQKYGRVLVTSSIAGLKGFGGASVYAATKFALEGWAETLNMEVEPFGISVTLSEPGFFRTDFLDESSASYGDIEIADYVTFSVKTRAQYDASNHEQPGDPAKYADIIVELMGQKKPPLRWAAGPDAYEVAQEKSKTLHDESKGLKKLSASTNF